MKNKGITLVSLVVTIVILIILAGVSLNLTLGENGIITIARKSKENMELAQVEEETKLNEIYAQIEKGEIGASGELNYDAILKLNEFKKAIADAIEVAGGKKPEYTANSLSFEESIRGIVAEVTKDATATEEQILEGQTAWMEGKKTTGTMKNNGELNGNLNCNQAYTIPKGYTSGGTIVANSLESQTQATATADNITAGKTAYVNGQLVTGTGADNTNSYNQGYAANSGTVTRITHEFLNNAYFYEYYDIADSTTTMTITYNVWSGGTARTLYVGGSTNGSSYTQLLSKTAAGTYTVNVSNYKKIKLAWTADSKTGGHTYYVTFK